jgi:hypothetical protein
MTRTVFSHLAAPGAAITDNGKGMLFEGGKPFTNRVRAGAVAKEQGGTVVPHPAGGYVVSRPEKNNAGR